jgi:hypothetical protein
MKHRKKWLFFASGASGGAAGGLLAELLPVQGQGTLDLAIKIALWSAAASGCITAGLFAAGEKHLRRPFSAAVYRRAFFVGGLAGAIAGFAAQSVYAFFQPAPLLADVLIRSLCWGLMGAILGARLSAAVPNLGFGRGVLAGGLGGFLGGLSFVASCLLLPELLGRLVGLAILGGALGLAVVAIEEAFRSASLEVIWGPGEATEVTIGASPVYLGGGDDHVFVRGLPRRALSVVLADGKILCMNHTNGTENQLKDGSRIRAGVVELVVHAKTVTAK